MKFELKFDIKSLLVDELLTLPCSELVCKVVELLIILFSSSSKLIKLFSGNIFKLLLLFKFDINSVKEYFSFFLIFSLFFFFD